MYKGLKSFLDFLYPSKMGVFLYSVAALVLIGTAKTPHLLGSITTTLGISDEVRRFGAVVAEWTKDYGSIPGVIVWFSLGAVLYLLLWVVTVVIIDGYNDVITSVSFVHPKSFHQSDYWVATAGRFLIRVSSCFLLLTLIILSIGRFIPSGYSSAQKAWAGGTLTSLQNFGLILVICFAVTHLSVLLLRLVFLRRRLFL